MNAQEKVDLSKKILQVIQHLQHDSEAQVNFAKISAPLTFAGVDYKQYDFLKLRPFLNEFQDVLEFKEECPVEGSPPRSYRRLNYGKSNDNISRGNK